MNKIAYLSGIIFISASCAVKNPLPVAPSENQDPLILSVLWFQKSAEAKALFYQGYNIAERSLAAKLEKGTQGKPKAVIMDIDETVLDNSPSEVFLIENNVPFSDDVWKKWVDRASAQACPGALEFVKYAQSRKVEVFYVTNRELPGELDPTIQNMKVIGFPFADTDHMICKTDISSKEPRRKALAGKYEILMLIGDNLADFDAVFDVRGADQGDSAVKMNRDKFGTDFIILPNPMYGPWINAAIKDQPGGTLREKMLNALDGF